MQSNAASVYQQAGGEEQQAPKVEQWAPSEEQQATKEQQARKKTFMYKSVLLGCRSPRWLNVHQCRVGSMCAHSIQAFRMNHQLTSSPKKALDLGRRYVSCESWSWHDQWCRCLWHPQSRRGGAMCEWYAAWTRAAVGHLPWMCYGITVIKIEKPSQHFSWPYICVSLWVIKTFHTHVLNVIFKFRTSSAPMSKVNRSCSKPLAE